MKRDELLAKFGTGAVVLVVVGGMAGLITYAECNYKHELRRYNAIVETRKRGAAEWQALVEVTPCLVAVRQAATTLAGTARQDPRTVEAYGWSEGALERCGQFVVSARRLGLLPANAAFLDGVVARLDHVTGPVTRLSDYYQHQDWRDDSYALARDLAPKVADDLRGLSAIEDAAILAVGDESVKTRRERLDAAERTEGRTPAWWKASLRVDMDDVSLSTLRGHGHAAAPAARLAELIAAAPLELRRSWRDIQANPPCPVEACATVAPGWGFDANHSPDSVQPDDVPGLPKEMRRPEPPGD